MVCGRGCEGTLGRLGAGGRGAPGAAPAPGTEETVLGASPIPAGMGCLGPDKICPGLGAGSGLAGIADPLVPGIVPGAGLPGAGIDGAAGGAGECAAGTAGGGGAGIWGATRGGAACGSGIDGGENDWPVDKGGRKGGARRTGCAATSSTGFGSCASFTVAAPASAAGDSGLRAAGFTGVCSRTGSGWAALSVLPSRRDTAGAEPPLSPVTFWRTCKATSSSSELECVFLSAIPSSANVSRITLGLTSSSRASSLMRILLIR